jgi:CRP/FNR family transcriptional regulator
MPELTRRSDDLAKSVPLGELAGLLHVPLPLQARLAAAPIGLQRMAPSDVLYRSGEPFESFYVVLSGLLKLAAVDDRGREQVLAFVLSGETAGVDGFQGGSHRVDAIALDAGEVALVPLRKLERLAELAGERELGEQLLHRILTQAMVQDTGVLWFLETLDARSRVAAFLLSLGKRLGRVHSAPVSLDLPMTNAEIGSYLRLPDEAVGSLLREFVEAGLIDVCERAVSHASLAGLAALVEQGRQAWTSRTTAAD